MEELTVQLSSNLKSKLEERLAGTEFESLEEYVRFVLSEVVNDDTETADVDDGGEDGREGIEQRLEDLGYL